MTQDKPAEWAVKLAQRITAVPSPERIESMTLRIARAIESAANAATERAALVVEAKRGSVTDWPESEMAKINSYTAVEVSRATSKVLIDQLAAAIRKGGENG